MINNLIREMLSAILQGIGWTIGMALCGLAFVAFHLIIWPVLILTFPVTIFLFWRNRHFVSQRWEHIRGRIWGRMWERYGYRHPTIIAIEAPKPDEGFEPGSERAG
jgi:hypothetical protein